MLWPILFTLIVILAIAGYQHSQRKSILRHGEKLRYGPGTLPILGNVIKFLQPRHLLFQWFIECQKSFGLETFAIVVPSLPAGVVINDPKNLEYVLKHESSITKGEFFRRRSWDLFGHGIINSDGELWKIQRKAGLKFFTGSNLDTLIEEVLPNAYMHTRSALLQHANSGEILDLEAVLLDLTTAVVGRMAYNMDINADSPFSRAFDHASDQTGRRFQNPLYFITELFTGSRFRSSLAEVKKFGQQIVSSAQGGHDRAQKGAASSEGPFNPTLGSLIDSLIDAFPHNPTLTADAALNFLSAGRDTTAQSLTWTFYSLMRHPSTVTDLRQEINSSAVPSQQHSRANPNPHPLLKLSVADLQPTNLPTTISIFNESLRLHPPVPFEIKQSQVNTTLPDGTFLPAGSIIVWCIWAMNRAREIWGGAGQHYDPEEFYPQRWLMRIDDDDDDATAPHNGITGSEGGGGVKVKFKLITKSPFEFPVFNAGPRSCLGKKMAELMACWVLVQVVREFDLEEAGELYESDVVSDMPSSRRRKLKERRSKNSLTLPMEGGLPCRVHLLSSRSRDLS